MCFLCDYERNPDFDKDQCKLSEMRFKNRVIRNNPEDKYYVVFPLEPAMFGHLLVILKTPKVLLENHDHIKDITDPKLDSDLLIQFIVGVQCFSRQIKEKLSVNGNNVEKVYLLSQCDGTEHFHFHLKPRFSSDRLRGDRFLLDKECEEARWTDSQEDLKKFLEKSEERIQEIGGIHDKYKKLIETSEWRKDDSIRFRWLNEIKSLL